VHVATMVAALFAGFAAEAAYQGRRTTSSGSGAPASMAPR
jgi:hypothetical protein